ncbi:MAG: hypothetical protein GYA36_09430 [Veillonellaceae bacterium]|nr:hypothetical protein [Veillonellaceae bacterium]
MELNMLELQNTLQRYGVMINFSGRFTQAIIEQLGDAVKKYLETEATSLTDTYNVFSVFIEQTQNIRNYDVKKADSPFGERIANSGIVAIGKTPTGYFVSSGNIVDNSDISGLTTLLEEIVGLDKAGLKKRYKEQLREAVPPGSTGAGLGFLDMARRASSPPTYSFTAVDENLSFFTLKVSI